MRFALADLSLRSVTHEWPRNGIGLIFWLLLGDHIRHQGQGAIIQDPEIRGLAFVGLVETDCERRVASKIPENSSSHLGTLVCILNDVEFEKTIGVELISDDKDTVARDG